HSALLGGSARDDTSAWVPGRNTLFMIAAGIYGHQIDADGIAIGYMRSDEGVFGDSNMLHHKIVETLLAKTLSRPMDVHLPLAQMIKMDVLQYLNDHGVIDLTVSCWNATLRDNRIQTCHTCANCVDREENLKGILYEYGKPKILG
ncbi:MAG: 7-cyano-7-deazaguanine synthase, partial [Candidatus Gottesmanbacteria bacterium]|nr:7-cyano-7-deazaguanine synthase [Candidatus Gottesmanbacteria bacterium]